MLRLSLCGPASWYIFDEIVTSGKVWQCGESAWGKNCKEGRNRLERFRQNTMVALQIAVLRRVVGVVARILAIFVGHIVVAQNVTVLYMRVNG